MMSSAAYLFSEGQAAYFVNGQQIPEFQKDGWLALNRFLTAYPDAEVTVSSLSRTGISNMCEKFDRKVSSELVEYAQYVLKVLETFRDTPEEAMLYLPNVMNLRTLSQRIVDNSKNNEVTE